MADCVGGTCKVGDTVRVKDPGGHLINVTVVSKTGNSAFVRDSKGHTSYERQDHIYK
jgi:hypothetical protein